MRNHEYLISAETLHENLGRRELCVIDCRFELKQPAAGWRKYLRAHVPGAVYADLDKDLAAPVRDDSGRHPLPDPLQLARTFGSFGIAPVTQVVVYDDANGAIAARAWWLLRWLGHSQVAVLDGGMARWQALGMPLQAGAVSNQRQQFTASPQPGMIIETAELVTACREGTAALLVDAREEVRFRGEQEPIDALAGHVPGARNLPYTHNLAVNGTWKSGAELRRLWSAVLAERIDEPFSVMCGSGVTACQLVLSSLLAGLDEPRVYIGSWSEWIRDPLRPVAIGPG
ncbi:MAG: sulfurtransferase [Gammaproteobacteria bacterium]|nr:sulfurtransferase [Gammaproteobacteria bacterium]